MSGEWKRPALEILLKLYKEHPILYDMRHPRYYNKNERQKVLNMIIDMLEDMRPGTTVNDILKKIQVMRTQFGQEYGKLRKAANKGVEYQPTVWWFNYLSFLRQHIKPRSMKDDEDDDSNINLSVTQNTDSTEYDTYATEETYEFENDGQSEIVYEIQSTPSGKGSSGKIEFDSETKVFRKRPTTSTVSIPHNGKEEIIYEITNANTLVPKRKIDVISMEEVASTPKQPRKDNSDTVGSATSVADQLASSSYSYKASPTTSAGGGQRSEGVEINVEPDRARSLGQFVASQAATIKDDFLFYSTQMDVLHLINKAQLKQLQMDKEASKEGNNKQTA